MSRLVDFLRARLDEDEAVAREADRVQTAPWGTHVLNVVTPQRLIVVSPRHMPLTEHIARHDPARVLAEVAATRSLIAQVATWAPAIQRPFLAPFAAVYADHPDYDEAWRP